MKQIIYGGVYLACVAGIIAAVYFAKWKPDPTCYDGRMNQGEEEADCGGPCVACAIRRLAPLEGNIVNAFDPGTGRATALLEFRNGNQNYGASAFSYTIRFRDRSGRELFAKDGSSFLYPGAFKYVVETDLAVPFETAGNGHIEIDHVAWVPAAAFSAPELETGSVSFDSRPDREELIVSGTLTNRASSFVSRVSITVLVSNALGVLAGVSKTQLRDLAPLEDRSFQVTVPGIADPASVDAESVQIYSEGER